MSAFTKNRVVLIGYLGEDPELNYVGDKGTAVCKLRIATQNKWWDKTAGEEKKFTEWNIASVWGKRAEEANKCKKGSRVYVEGRMQTNKWVDKQGATRYSTEVKSDEFAELSPPRQQELPTKPAPPPTNGDRPGGDDSDDLPF